MMQIQMQLQAIQYQCDREEKAPQEKLQLEELKEECEESCVDCQARMVMFMAMCGADGSNINSKTGTKPNKILVHQKFSIF
jgi:hypothetical protein